jgi:hypothetical protein
MTFTPRIHENGNICCAAYNAAGEPIPSPSQCDTCTTYFAALKAAELRTSEAHPDLPHAPNPYEPHLKKLRAASMTPEQAFEARYRAERLAAFEAEYARAAAHREANPIPRLTAAELSPYAAPDGFAEGLKALQAANRRRREAKESK